MSNKVHGLATITIGGKRQATKEGATLNIGGIEREPVIGDGGVLGYTEKHVPSTLECTVAYKDDTKLKDYQAMVDETILFESDTGREYILRGAFLTNSPKIEKDGVPLSFSAIDCDEV